MLNYVEHEKSFIILGPGIKINFPYMMFCLIQGFITSMEIKIVITRHSMFCYCFTSAYTLQKKKCHIQFYFILRLLDKFSRTPSLRANFIFAPFMQWGQVFRQKKLLLEQQILSFKKRFLYRRLLSRRKANMKSQKVFPICKHDGEKTGRVSINLNFFGIPYLT